MNIEKLKPWFFHPLRPRQRGCKGWISAFFIEKLFVSQLFRKILTLPLLAFIFYFSCFTSQAQPIIDIYGIGGAGWWIAHNGQPGQEDKSLVEFQAGAGIRLGYATGTSWEFGLVTEWDRILGYYLRAAGDRVGFRDRIRIAENEAFSIMRYGLYAQAWPAKGRSFRMGPQLAFGVFTENSIHPDKHNFSNRYWWAASVPMEWSLGEALKLQLAPTYYLHSIRESLPAGGPERHTIDKVGGLLGLRLDF